MKNTPLISIVTVNYNQSAVTADFLASLHQLTYRNFEVIVVDNASAQPSAFLKEQFPFITHITSPANTGFAGGYNLGLHYAKGEFVFFVDSDTEVTSNLLDVLVDHMQKNPKCAIACPKIKYFDKPAIIQYAGAVGLHPLTSQSYDIGYMQNDDGTFSDIRKTDLPNATAMLIPMKLIRDLGPMSELFFLYFEELDWAARFKKAGYEIHYVGTTNIFHKESISTRKNSAFKTFYLYKNRLLYIRRNYQGYRKFISVAFYTVFLVPSHVLHHLQKGEWDHAWAIIRGLTWNIHHPPFKEPASRSSDLISQLIVA